MGSLQAFVVVHSSVHNLSITGRILTSRRDYKHAHNAALADWRALCAT